MPAININLSGQQILDICAGLRLAATHPKVPPGDQKVWRRYATRLQQFSADQEHENSHITYVIDEDVVQHG